MLLKTQIILLNAINQTVGNFTVNYSKNQQRLFAKPVTLIFAPNVIFLLIMKIKLVTNTKKCYLTIEKLMNTSMIKSRKEISGDVLFVEMLF